MSDTEQVDHIRAPWTSRWSLETDSGSARDVLDADGALVARLDSPLDEREDKARAARIAAAPDLLDMLDEVLATFGDANWNAERRALVERGWALVAKARGDT